MCRVLQCEKYRITQGYKTTHRGVDMVKYYSELCPIIAHTDGKVVWIQTGQKNNPVATGNKSYGNCVKLKHSNGYYTLYAHMSEVYVKNGATVKKGAKIGFMGNTGRSFGAHLHFEVRDTSDTRINPTPYIDADLPSGKTYQAYDNKKNKWLPKVYIGSNEYAGNLGNGISAYKVDGYTYRAHDRVKGYWLPWVSGSKDYAGNLPNDIDAIQIQNAKYRVYDNVKNKWLPWVEGTKDYAGNLGHSIGGIQIK